MGTVRGNGNTSTSGGNDPSGLPYVLQTETTNYYYDGSDVFKEYGSNGEPLAQYYTADGQTMARQMFGDHARKQDGYEGNIRTRGGLMYYQYDGLGNVMDITDRLGSQVMGYRYDAFGNLFTRITQWVTRARRMTPKPA
jgi:YD repeat-containing protein